VGVDAGRVDEALLSQVPAGATGEEHGGHGGGGAASGDLFHPSVGLVILLAITALNVYKPRGVTPYGWRKLQEERGGLAAPAQRA
jgi:hypothetical protein